MPRVMTVMCALHFTAGKHPGYLLPRNLKWFEIQFMHLYYTSNSPRNCITPIHSPCSSPDSSEVSAVASPQDEQTFKGSKATVTAGEIKSFVAGVAAAVPVQFLPKQFTTGYERMQR